MRKRHWAGVVLVLVLGTGFMYERLTESPVTEAYEIDPPADIPFEYLRDELRNAIEMHEPTPCGAFLAHLGVQSVRWQYDRKEIDSWDSVLEENLEVAKQETAEIFLRLGYKAMQENHPLACGDEQEDLMDWLTIYRQYPAGHKFNYRVIQRAQRLVQ